MPSYFTTAFTLKPTKKVKVAEIIAEIRKPSKHVVELVKELREITDHRAAQKFKTNFPGYTISGDFEKRETGGLIEHTHLYVYDFDQVKDVEKCKKSVEDVESMVMAFVSPSGNGVKVVLRGPACKEGEHLANWEAGVAILEQATWLEVDKSGSDVTRLCYVSHDPALIVGTGFPFDRVKSKAAKVGGVEGDEDRDDIDDIMGKMKTKKVGSTFKEYNLKVVKEMLWSIGSNHPYDVWRNIIFAVTSEHGNDQQVFDLLFEWSTKQAGNRKDVASESDLTKVFNCKKEGITLATLIKLAHAAGWKNWRKMLFRDEENVIMKNDVNLDIILSHHPDFKERFYFDEIAATFNMTEKKDVDSCPLSSHGGLLEEPLAFNVLCDIQGSLGIQFRGSKNVLTAMNARALKNRRNVRVEWLNSLVWDKRKRLHELFVKGFGAPNEGVNRVAGISFIASAAARMLRPGVSVQTIPILSGPQGCGKSSGIAALCPTRDWMCDSHLDFESKAGYEVIRSAAIVEISELSAMKKSSIEKVKQVLTQSSVTFRAPFERNAKDIKSSWVFIGTTNEQVFLKDTTGNRRFIPITVAEDWKAVDGVKWILKNRDQLWAEACEIVKYGFDVGENTWGIPPSFWGTIKMKTEGAREKSPWEDAVHDYTSNEKPKEIIQRSLKEVANECGINIRNISDEWTLGKIMRMMCWEKRRIKREQKLVWVWERAALGGTPS